MATKRSDRQTETAKGDSLAQLLDAELALDELLRLRQREADDVVAAAESDARRRHEELVGAFEREASALEKSIEDDRRRRIEDLRRSAVERQRRWDESSQQAIDQLAGSVVSWVIRGTGDAMENDEP